MKIAFVVQRYGVEVCGGSEVLCRLLAEQLSAHHEVTVLTTCANDHFTWKDEYPAGSTRINNVTVIRFPVDSPRDIDKFNQLADWIYSHPHSHEDEVNWMRLQGPYSSKLLQFLRESHEKFDLFIFFTYLYATTYFGLREVPGRAWLVPTAHDEPPIYLSLFEEVFARPEVLIFLTDAEREFVRERFPRLAQPSEIVGAGINIPADIRAERFVAKYLGGQPADFLFYVGRIDPGKGCPELFSFFSRYVEEKRRPELRLLLAGKAAMPIPPSPSVVPLGFVSEQDKFDGIAAATVLVAPSLYESLSLSALEAWHLGIPVLANGRCRVLQTQCQRSNAGLWYTNYAEFAEALSFLLDHPQARSTLGEHGKKFVEENYSWPVVLGKYGQLLKTYAQGPAAARPLRTAGLPVRGGGSEGDSCFHILLFCCTPGDAVSNDALTQYEILREAGYSAVLYAESTKGTLPKPVRPASSFSPDSLPKKKNVLIYHYTIGWERGWQIFEQFPGLRLIRYHNVTPESFFYPYSNDFYQACRRGRRDILQFLQVRHDAILANSEFSVNELVGLGADPKKCSALAPFHQTPELEQMKPSEKIVRRFRNGFANILFVGRVVPNKAHDQLIRTFGHYHNHYNPRSRLIIAGPIDSRLEGYLDELRRLIHEENLEQDVIFTDFVSAAELKGLYTVADVFLCTSKHEGFGVPVVEAMAFGVPVVACGLTSVREITEGAGIWWSEADEELLAQSIHSCVQDPRVAKTIARAQLNRYVQKYSLPALREAFLAAVCGTTRSRSLSMGALGESREKIQKIPEDLTLRAGIMDEDAMVQIRDYLAHSVVTPEATAELLGYVQEASRRLVFTLCLVPDRPGRLLELGANPYFFTLLLKKFREYQLELANFHSERQPYDTSHIYQQEIHNQKYGEHHVFGYRMFNIEKDVFPYENKTFDVVLFCEILEHLTIDPLFAFREIHRVLNAGGTLILTTPNVARRENVYKLLAGKNIYDPYSGYGLYGRHNREYSPKELAELVSGVGFDIEQLCTKDVHPDAERLPAGLPFSNPPEMQGQYIFVRAHKARSFSVCYPDWLYRSMAGRQ